MEQNITEKVLVDKQKVDMFIMSNQKYFPAEKIMFLREKLYALDETRFSIHLSKLSPPCIKAGKRFHHADLIEANEPLIVPLASSAVVPVISIFDWIT